jgi:hypothetical protein
MELPWSLEFGIWSFSWWSRAASLSTKDSTKKTQHEKLKAQRSGSNHAQGQLPYRKLHRKQPKADERSKYKGSKEIRPYELDILTRD